MPNWLSITGSSILVVLMAIITGWFLGTIFLWLSEQSVYTDLQNMQKQGMVSLDKKIRVFEKAVQLKPKNYQLRMQLATTYIQKSRYRKVALSYQQEAVIAANDAWNIFKKKSGVEPAKLLSSPEAQALRLSQADILAEAGKELAAKNIYESLLQYTKSESLAPEVLPLRSSILNNAAYLFLRSDNPEVQDFKRGKNLAQQCIKFSTKASKSPAFLDTLALAYYCNGDYKQAKNVQRQALALAPGNHLYDYLQHWDLFNRQ